MVRHSRHRFEPVSQFGASSSVQSPSVMQLTHVPVAGSHTERGATHNVRLVVEHSPQRPLRWQAGALAVQSASVKQARHVLVVASQIAVGVPTQSSSVMQATQRLEEGSHSGVSVPLHAVAFWTEH